MAMRLREWRLTHKLTLAGCAEMLGVGHARNFQKYETGENRPDAPMVERIVVMTGGVVALDDIHAQRLDWLREHKPEAFSDVPARLPELSHQEAAE